VCHMRHGCAHGDCTGARTKFSRLRILLVDMLSSPHRRQRSAGSFCAAGSPTSSRARPAATQVARRHGGPSRPATMQQVYSR